MIPTRLTRIRTGDTIKDGDELLLGLDPKNPETFGVPDAEYTMEQMVSAESDVFSEINTEESPYRLSVTVTAAGYVEGGLTVKETGYAKAIENEFMVGIAPELSYDKEDSIASVTVSFQMDGECIDDGLELFPDEEEFSGIKRFNVFKYFEDINMLLPVKTEFDVENNRIYATTDELGTYCVMDMERWFLSLGMTDEQSLFSIAEEADAEGTMEEEFRLSYQGPAETERPSGAESVTLEKTVQGMPAVFSAGSVPETPVDIVFLLQASGMKEVMFENQKQLIAELSKRLCNYYRRGIARVSVVVYHVSDADFLTSSKNDIWFYQGDNLANVLNQVEYEYTEDFVDRGIAFDKVQEEAEFRENAARYIFQIMNGVSIINSKYFTQMASYGTLGVNYSELVPEGFFYEGEAGEKIAEAIAATGGISIGYSIAMQEEIQEIMFQHVKTNTVAPETKFNVIVPTGWRHIELKRKLDPENNVDTDEDGLTDWEEVDTAHISWDAYGNIVLPTIQDCMNFTEKPYATEGLNRYIKTSVQAPENSPSYQSIFEKIVSMGHILPIFSDPTMEDSDGDELLDLNDPMPLTEKNFGLRYVNMNDDKNTELIQKCLVFLGYLDMKNNAYGTFGGLTVAATKLYQLNHRMYEEDESLKIVEESEQTSGRTVWLDEITFYSIICEVLRYNFDVSELSYNELSHIDYSKLFFKNKYIPQSIKPKQINVSLNYYNPIYIIPVRSDLSNEKTDIYTYDMTVPLEGMLRQGAQEFHFHHYTCNATFSPVESMNWNYMIYANSNSCCRRNRSAYLWLYSQVANDKRYDIKKKKSWNNFFKGLNLIVPYYNSAFPFVFNNIEINAEFFGNILYGFVGNAGGYSEKELLFGGNLYSLDTTGEGDDEDDVNGISMGFKMYDTVKMNYNYIHIIK